MADYLYKVDGPEGFTKLHFEHSGSTLETLHARACWLSTPTAYISGKDIDELRSKISPEDQLAFEVFYQDGLSALTLAVCGVELPPWIDPATPQPQQPAA